MSIEQMSYDKNVMIQKGVDNGYIMWYSVRVGQEATVLVEFRDQSEMSVEYAEITLVPNVGNKIKFMGKPGIKFEVLDVIWEYDRDEGRLVRLFDVVVYVKRVI